MMKGRIGIIGSDGKISPDLSEIAENIGKDIAENNCILICGGRSGVMESACRGAKKAGGITVGILPSLAKEDSNPWVDVPITTGMGYGRNNLIVASSDVLIAIDGRVGTLSEIALALNYNKAVIAVKESKGVASSIQEKLKEMGIEKEIHCTSARDAVKLALRLIE